MAHVEKRGKTSWRLVVTIGYDERGVPIRERKTIRARNKTEAEKQLALFEAEILRGEYVRPERMTLNDLYQEWDDNVTTNELSIRTKEGYKSVIKRRILPKYGHMNIHDMRPIHVQNFVNGLSKDGARLDGKSGGLSTSSINNCYNAFNSILEFAKRMTWIRKNPADNVKPPTEQNKEVEIYTPEELSRLFKGLDEIDIQFRHKVMIYIALTSSARQAEIAALEEQHCDFDRNGIHIEQSLTIQSKKGVRRKKTKTNNKRFITLPKKVMEMIKKLIHIRKQELFMAGDKRVWPDHLFLFGNEFGRPYRPDSISQWWSRFVNSDRFKSLGLKPIRFHDLRHSSLTLISQMGARAKLVQQRAGHTRIGTTFDIYGHVLKEEDQEASSFIEGIFPDEA